VKEKEKEQEQEKVYKKRENIRIRGVVGEYEYLENQILHFSKSEPLSRFQFFQYPHFLIKRRCQNFHNIPHFQFSLIVYREFAGEQEVSGEQCYAQRVNVLFAFQKQLAHSLGCNKGRERGKGEGGRWNSEEWKGKRKWEEGITLIRFPLSTQARR
jgi:hypothetical protein